MSAVIDRSSADLKVTVFAIEDAKDAVATNSNAGNSM